MEKQDTKHSATVYNTQPAGLEKWLDETLNKKSSVQLPEGGKAWLASNVWWIALVGGIASLWAALSFWQLGHNVDRWVQYANDMARVYGAPTTVSNLGVMWYVSLAAMLVQGVLLLTAFQQLKEHKKSGWNLLFYSSLVSVVVGVSYLFTPSYGANSLIGMLIGTVVGWFFLFQIRERFSK